MARKIAAPAGWTREGFPLSTCTRCGGTGRYSFNQIDGDRCYGCSGSGYQIHKAAKAAHAEYAKAAKAAFRPTAAHLSVGDVILEHYTDKQSKAADEDWARIIDIEVTDKVMGRGGYCYRTREQAEAAYAVEAEKVTLGHGQTLDINEDVTVSNVGGSETGWFSVGVTDRELVITLDGGQQKRCAGNSVVNRQGRNVAMEARLAALATLPEALRRPAKVETA